MAIVSSRPDPNDSTSNGSQEGKQPAKTRRKPKSPSEKPPGLNSDLLQANAAPDEGEKQEANLRPQTLEEYIGQPELKRVFGIAVGAAKARSEPLEHALLYGPPGLGKTTLALLLANALGVECKITSAPSFESPKDIVGVLNSLEAGQLLFIDEIHRLNKVTEEILYTAMEDYRIDVVLGKGVGARTQSIPLKRFTLVGATTKIGSLSAPLRDRFGIIHRLDFYNEADLKSIVVRTAGVLNIEITEPAALLIAQRSRGTPRIANRLLRRVRDYVQVTYGQGVTEQIALEALEVYQVDSKGLDSSDRRLLEWMIQRYNGGPVGLNTLAAGIGEESATIEDVNEPFLLQLGFLMRTPRGREVTPQARIHLGYPLPPDAAQQLPVFTVVPGT